MKEIGILFSGSRRNADLANSHIREHGIVYWCLAKNMKYANLRFPITALIHVKKEGVRYKCFISDVMPFSPLHFSDLKKKPKIWVQDQHTTRKKYRATLAISKISTFYYNTKKLKNCEGIAIGNAPQGGYIKIIIP